MTGLSIWQQVLGPHFQCLPAALQCFHGLQGRHVLIGGAEVTAPASAVAGWLARLLGMPRQAGPCPLHFVLLAGPAGEHWRRDFGGHPMTTRLTAQGAHIVEAVGPAGLLRLGFALRANADALEMQLAWLRVIGLPWPRRLLPKVVAHEHADEVKGIHRVLFDIQVSLPLLGALTRYRGHLDLAAKTP